MSMTYRDLLEKLSAMPVEYIDEPVKVHRIRTQETFAVDDLVTVQELFFVSDLQNVEHFVLVDDD